MTTIFWIDGGLGRVITAIPALLKYHKNHPNEEWYIMIPGWDYVSWGFPELQERTFNPDVKGIFENYFMKADKVISVEPYRVPDYYRGLISIRESFDVVINDTNNHDDLPPMQLKISFPEKRAAFDIIQEAKQKFGKEKTIVIQPYGSSSVIHKTGICDDSMRSIPQKMLNYFIEKLSKNYNLIFMWNQPFNDPRVHQPGPDVGFRKWAAIIEQADYFIGCDSCGQHMRKCANKKASVVITSTDKKNTTYEDFHIIERDIPLYTGNMRISGFQSLMAANLNEPRMEFTKEEIENACEEIIEHIETI